MWMFLALAAIAAPPKQSTPAKPASLVSAASASATAPSTHTRFSESKNFVVRSYLVRPQAGVVAQRCESVCCQLRQELLGQEETADWKPKCEVVLHPSRASYLQAVGRGAAQTVGSSIIRTRGGNVLLRRIDLLAEDRDRALDALPHELVHVLFAELFPEAPCPRWAEEGLALLHDTADKQGRHRSDLRYALQTDTALPLQRLLDAADYPSGWQRAAFYAQSLSLVDYLTRLDSHEQFVRFLQAYAENGSEHALQSIYGIQGVADLERRWREHALTASSENSSALK